MATLQRRNDSYRILFAWHGKRHAFTVGKVSTHEAQSKLAQVEYLIMRLQQRLLTLPAGCDIDTFLQFDGKPPITTENDSPQAKRVWLLDEFTQSYLDTNETSLEASTVP